MLVPHHDTGQRLNIIRDYCPFSGIERLLWAILLGFKQVAGLKCICRKMRSAQAGRRKLAEVPSGEIRSLKVRGLSNRQEIDCEIGDLYAECRSLVLHSWY